jgi:hypothetical protein
MNTAAATAAAPSPPSLQTDLPGMTRDIQYQDPDWFQARINRLDANAFQDHDLEWLDGTAVYRDFKCFYASLGDFFSAVVRHSSTANDLTSVQLSGFMRTPVLFRFLRVYCHTGIVLLQDNEPFQQLFEKYEMMTCYNMTRAVGVLVGALDAKMDSAGCIHALLNLCGTELQQGPVCALAEQYFKRHVHDCLRKLTPSVVSKMTTDQFDYLLHLMSEDDVNSGECELWEELYALLCKRHKHDVHCVRSALRLNNDFGHDCSAADECSSSSGDSDSQSTIDTAVQESPLKRLRSSSSTHEAQSMRAMDIIRISGLSFQDVMTFRDRHSSAFPPEYYMQLLNAVHKSSSPDKERPRHYVPTSSFPLTLCFPKQLQGSHVTTTLCALNHNVCYVAVPWMKQGFADVPPFMAAGCRIVSMRIAYQGQHMHASGTVDVGLARSEDSDLQHSAMTTSIELRVINFCRDRMRKSATALDIAGKAAAAFNIQRIILISTLGNDYTFAPEAYPTIRAGSHVLLKVTTRTEAGSAPGVGIQRDKSTQ